jgi:hypothetical protein
VTYAGISAPLAGFLTGQTGIRTLTRRPADLQSVLPINQVVAPVGGWSDRNSSRLKVPRADIGSFAAADGDAEKQAIEVERLIRDVLPGMTLGGVTITGTETMSLPGWRPYDDTNVFYYGGLYVIYFMVNP